MIRQITLISFFDHCIKRVIYTYYFFFHFALSVQSNSDMNFVLNCIVEGDADFDLGQSFGLIHILVTMISAKIVGYCLFPVQRINYDVVFYIVEK